MTEYETINEQLRDSFYHNPQIEAMLNWQGKTSATGQLDFFCGCQELAGHLFCRTEEIGHIPFSISMTKEDNMEVARRFTRRLHELPSEELELIAGLFVRREVHKGELLISEKDIARDIVFVEKGLLRQFYFKEGRDITENFACDGDGAMCIVSLFTGRRNCLQLESLEEGVIWSISYAGLVELSERYLHIARLLRHLLEGSLMLSQYKADSWRFETSRERYARFVRDYPEIARRASSQPHSILSVNDSVVSEPGTCGVL